MPAAKLLLARPILYPSIPQPGVAESSSAASLESLSKMGNFLAARALGRFKSQLFHSIGDRQAPVFIHVPKTGGTYLGQLEALRRPVLWPVRYEGHKVVVEGDRPAHPESYPPVGLRNRRNYIPRAELEGRLVFSTVRNIYDWLVSYAGHAGGWNPRYDHPSHYDYAVASKGFDYLVRTIADREAPWPCRKLIHFQLFSEGGDLVVDWINRTETLDADLERFAKETNIRFSPGRRQRSGKRSDYRQYYDDRLIELVQETWGRELALFGYGFDGCQIERAVIGNRVSADQKRALRYVWQTDQLTGLHEMAAG